MNLLDLIITNPQHKQLLLIGAYRDNEVDDFHPLISSLKQIESKQGKINSIVLKPLLENDLSEITRQS
ncbi:MAG: hypothetical protein HQK77_21205 [Desulfobacterales bacterium]|nr:hypothetical protein [Desulfobacterales bacterium]